MPAPLVIEHFDVVEQLHLGLAALEAIGHLALDARTGEFNGGSLSVLFRSKTLAILLSRGVLHATNQKPLNSRNATGLCHIAHSSSAECDCKHFAAVELTKSGHYAH